ERDAADGLSALVGDAQGLVTDGGGGEDGDVLGMELPRDRCGGDADPALPHRADVKGAYLDQTERERRERARRRSAAALRRRARPSAGGWGGAASAVAGAAAAVGGAAGAGAMAGGAGASISRSPSPASCRCATAPAPPARPALCCATCAISCASMGRAAAD